MNQEKYEDLWDRPGYLVRRLHQVHIGLFTQACGELDLTAVQFAILSVLCTDAELDQLSISKLVGIDRTSGADVIKRLVNRGLATRERSKQDRRALIVRITDAGRRTVRDVRPLMEDVQDKMVSPLTDEEYEVFMRALRKMVEANNEASRAPMRKRV
ncbi:MarR family winged helix-turn-helix transcriptional regulator [Leisingera sp.]|uniref:MarR family winged helix-turn-helix transcriptional regulator n=1 Tax=Leisingera sp. TaxID=1879318 RepID=UPI002B269456|nr:MarR family winged helix-turn-helix transcriptional regulator [Leisingera sp.]